MTKRKTEKQKVLRLREGLSAEEAVVFVNTKQKKLGDKFKFVSINPVPSNIFGLSLISYTVFYYEETKDEKTGAN